ncbi:MAG TPA: exodeoxyribonuclease VII large subunit [Nitrospiria bacterium]|nr:exodeoxyribonuclease VII large subunit [Nitrospiria bacterium]
MQEPKSFVLTVSALNQLIQLRLEEAFPEIWVEGEIANLRIPSSGHVYLTLKDESSQIRAVIFRSKGQWLKFIPQDGMHVLCRGQVSVYEPRGEYQLLVSYIEPRGIGALQLAFEQLKERLKSEGLFDPARKRPLPLLPKRIGVVTSPTGAALQDILKVLRRRFANVAVTINPVPVQGEGAALAIAAAIEELNTLGGIDVMIVGRGGGSLSDLWAFNSEVVARAICASRIPVISAVGHEIDYTISDFVADLRAPTPSAAAEMVVQSKREFTERIRSWTDRLVGAVRFGLEVHRTNLRHEAGALRDPRKVIETYFLRLDELESRIRQGVRNTLRHHRKRLSHFETGLGYQSPLERLERIVVGLDHTLMRLKQGVSLSLKGYRARMEGTLGRLDSLSPLAVLTRGYSLTYRLPEMRLVREARAVAKGDHVYVRLHQGGLVCGVDEVKGEGDGPT